MAYVCSKVKAGPFFECRIRLKGYFKGYTSGFLHTKGYCTGLFIMRAIIRVIASLSLGVTTSTVARVAIIASAGIRATSRTELKVYGRGFGFRKLSDPDHPKKGSWDQKLG